MRKKLFPFSKAGEQNHELRTNVLIQSKGASGMLIDCMLNYYLLRREI